VNTTLHDLLDAAGFPWDTGTLILHRTGTVSPGWAHPTDIDQRIRVNKRTPAIHVPFDTAAGTPDMPRFIAYDPGRVWIPFYDDVNTGIIAINLDANHYLGEGNMTPYPGGIFT
jgi:hypothetical protein